MIKEDCVMKKLLSKKATAVALIVIAALFLAAYVYMIARPISYEKEYTFSGTVMGYEFETTTVFHRNNRVSVLNMGFDEPQELYYYYKSGWVFLCYASTDEEYAAEVERINGDFDAAVTDQLYAAELNAFTYSYGDDADGTKIVQSCAFAKNFAIVGVVIELFLIALAVATVVCRKKCAK